MLCDSCRHELYGQCFCNRTVYQQIEGMGGYTLKNIMVERCPRYERESAEKKQHMKQEAEWHRELKAVDFEVDKLFKENEDDI